MGEDQRTEQQVLTVLTAALRAIEACEPSREVSLARTKTQEAMLWMAFRLEQLESHPGG